MRKKLNTVISLLLAMMMVTMSLPAFAENDTDTNDSDTNDSDIQLMSLLPLETVDATLDLSDMLPVELANIKVSDILSRMKDEDTGEAISIDSSAVTAVWSSFMGEDGDIESNVWKKTGINDTVDLMQRYWQDERDWMDIIVGSGNQLDPDNIRYNVEITWPNAESIYKFDLYEQVETTDGTTKEIKVSRNPVKIGRRHSDYSSDRSYTSSWEDDGSYVRTPYVYLSIAPTYSEDNDIMEATVSHTYTKDDSEQWTDYEVENIGLESGCHIFNHYLYYIDEATGQFVRDKEINGYTFDRNGKYTTGNVELDSSLHSVLTELCTNEAGKEENLRAVYDYVRDNFVYQARAHIARGAKGWELEYAVPMMRTHYGNCYSWASVFMYLARNVGYEAYCQSGAVGKNIEDHGWTEIMFDGEWLIFDPELEHANHQRWSFYKLSYDNDFKKYYKYEKSGSTYKI